MRVLILDGRQRSALAATRSFGRRGLEVHIADSHPRSLAGASRFASGQFTYPDPSRQPRAFVEAVLRLTRELDVQAVLPLTDLTTMLLVAHEKEFAPVSLLCAPATAYETVTDKANLLELAQRIGVHVPATVSVRGLDELDGVLAGRTFPLVMKPARSKVLLGGNVVNTEVAIVESAREAHDYLARQPWLGALPCLLQEFVPGHGAGIFAMYVRGAATAWFCHRRLREKPPAGGVSVLSESVDIAPDLQRAAQLLLDAANWSGAAMVEFRVAHDGTPYLMEINGRLWGSLQLAIDAGVDFPWLLLQASRGEDAVVADYQRGRRLRWLLGDVDNLLIQLRDRALSGRTRIQAVRRFLMTCFDLSCRQEVFRLSDPRPALREFGSWLSALR